MPRPTIRRCRICDEQASAIGVATISAPDLPAGMILRYPISISLPFRLTEITFVKFVSSTARIYNLSGPLLELGLMTYSCVAPIAGFSDSGVALLEGNLDGRRCTVRVTDTRIADHLKSAPDGELVQIWYSLDAESPDRLSIYAIRTAPGTLLAAPLPGISSLRLFALRPLLFGSAMLVLGIALEAGLALVDIVSEGGALFPLSMAVSGVAFGVIRALDSTVDPHGLRDAAYRHPTEVF